MDARPASRTSSWNKRHWLLALTGVAGGTLLLAFTDIERSDHRRAEPGARNNYQAAAVSATDAVRQVRAPATPALAHRGDDGVVSVGDNYFTVIANNQALKTLSELVSRRTGVPIHVAPDLEHLSLQTIVKEQSIDAGLRALFRNFDTVFSYEAGEPMIISGVWVYPEGTVRNIEPRPRADQVSTPAAEQQPTVQDASARAQAIETQLEIQGGDADEVMSEALEDPDELVRSRALDAALIHGVHLETDVLQRLLQSDPSPQVRLLALTGLADDPRIGLNELRILAQMVLDDPDEAVKTQAREILGREESIAETPSEQLPAERTMP